MGIKKETAASAGITEKQAKRNLWFFPLGTFGRDMIYSLFTNYILLYVLFTHHLTPAQLMAITGIMIGARVFDALNDLRNVETAVRATKEYGAHAQVATQYDSTFQP